jgi:hypothetical protein
MRILNGAEKGLTIVGEALRQGTQASFQLTPRNRALVIAALATVQINAKSLSISLHGPEAATALEISRKTEEIKSKLFDKSSPTTKSDLEKIKTIFEEAQTFAQQDTSSDSHIKAVNDGVTSIERIKLSKKSYIQKNATDSMNHIKDSYIRELENALFAALKITSSNKEELESLLIKTRRHLISGSTEFLSKADIDNIYAILMPFKQTNTRR